MSNRGAVVRMLTESPGWKIVENILDRIVEDSVKEEDRMPTAEMNLAVIAEQRGIRLGIERFINELDEIANEQ